MTLDHHRAIIFIIVGALNSLVGLSVIYSAMYFFGLNYILSNILGYIIGIITSFFINKKITFRDGSPDSQVFIRYIIAVFLGYLANLILIISTASFLGLYVAQFFGVLAYSVLVFFLCRFFVFRV